jgi:hypothetical protein
VTDFEVPDVLPDDPEDGAELLRRFGEHQAHKIPYEAMELFVKGLWPAIDEFSTEAVVGEWPHGPSAIGRLIEAGASPQDLSAALRAAAYSGVFAVLTRLDNGRDWDAPEARGWRLVETTGGGEPELTGREMTGLHELIAVADPSGRGGSDLFD